MRGTPVAQEQYRRFRELQATREKDLSTPMPSLTVKQSYDQFAAEKLAERGEIPMGLSEAFGQSIRSNMVEGVGKGIGNAIGDVFVRTPVDEATKYFKKRFIAGPKHTAALEAAMQDDDVLNTTDRSKIDSAHGTLKRFSPSLAEDPNAVRSYLRTAVMSHGGVDLATIRMLLDAEKTRQAGKGKFVLP